MRIVLAVPSSATQLSGVTRHAVNVARCLLTRDEVSQVHLLVAPWQEGHIRDAMPADKRLTLHIVPLGTNIWSRNLWYYRELPRLARKLSADLVHLAYPAPLHSGEFNCPVVVSLHDLYPYDVPENFGFPKVLFNRAILRQCLANADAIACVSESTLQRLGSWSPKLAREKATRIYNCVEPVQFSSLRGPLPHWTGEPFLLCVAQHRRNKNIVLALKVFQRLLLRGSIDTTTRFVILGLEGPETRRILRFIETNGLARSVLLLGGISDEDLQWCYRNCRVLLAPSVVEGFGLPVAEAMLAGCAIVCSDIPAFRELNDGACHYVALEPSETTSVENFAHSVRVAMARERVAPIALPRLSPQILGAEYMRLYTSLLSSATVRSANVMQPRAAVPAQKGRAS